MDLHAGLAESEVILEAEFRLYMGMATTAIQSHLSVFRSTFGVLKWHITLRDGPGGLFGFHVPKIHGLRKSNAVC